MSQNTACHVFDEYENALSRILTEGRRKEDRTGTGTISLFGMQMRFDLSKGFPLVTTKALHTRSIFTELLWMLNGDTNIKYLNDRGVSIWDEWADEKGDLGPVYGKQWRQWPGTAYSAVASEDPMLIDFEGVVPYNVYQEPVDQIKNVLTMLRTNPDSRRLIVSAWNPAEVPSMALPPCHMMFQLYTEELSFTERLKLLHEKDIDWKALPNVEAIRTYLDSYDVPRRRLSCQLYQRSADFFLGIPFNIASYALLTHMFADQAGMAVGDFVWTGGDCHIYTNHLDQVQLQLTRDPRPAPKLTIKNKRPDMFSYELEDFLIEGYDPHPHIKGDVAV